MSFRIGNLIPPAYVGYWTATQSTTASMPDRSGKGNDITLVGSPTVNASGVTFNGTSQYGTIPALSLANLHTSIGVTTDLVTTGLLATHVQSVIWTETYFYVANTQAGAGSEWSIEKRLSATPAASGTTTVTLKADAQAVGMDTDITHIGDGCMVDDVLYYPTDDWTAGGTTIAGILSVDPDTLEPIAWYQATGGVTEISGLDYDDAEKVFYATSFDTRNVRKIAGPGHSSPIGTLIDTVALNQATVDPINAQGCAIIQNRITGVKELWIAKGGSSVPQPVYDLEGNYLRTYRNPATHSGISFHDGTLYVLGSPMIESWDRVDEIVDGLTAFVWISLGAATSSDNILGQYTVSGNHRAFVLMVNGAKLEARISSGASANTVTSAGDFLNGTMEMVAMRFNGATNLLDQPRGQEGGSLTTATNASATLEITAWNHPVVLMGLDPAVGAGQRPPGTVKAVGLVGRYMSDTELTELLADSDEPLGTVETSLSHVKTVGDTLTIAVTNLGDDAATPDVELPDGWSVVTNDEIASGATGNVVLSADRPTPAGNSTAYIGGNAVTLRVKPARRRELAGVL